MNILVIDDHLLFRDGLRLILQRLGENLVVREASRIEAVMPVTARSELPDLILLDILLPGVKGAEGVSYLRERFPSARLLLISGSDDQSVINACLSAGADGFIHKSASAAGLLKAVKQALAIPTASVESAYGPTLTRRQRAVLAAVCEGLTNREIAIRLKVSENTVRVHLSTIFRQLGVKNRTHASNIARQLGLDRCAGS